MEALVGRWTSCNPPGVRLRPPAAGKARRAGARTQGRMLAHTEITPVPTPIGEPAALRDGSRYRRLAGNGRKHLTSAGRVTWMRFEERNRVRHQWACKDLAG